MNLRLPRTERDGVPRVSRCSSGDTMSRPWNALLTLGTRPSKWEHRHTVSLKKHQRDSLMQSPFSTSSTTGARIWTSRPRSRSAKRFRHSDRKPLDYSLKHLRYFWLSGSRNRRHSASSLLSSTRWPQEYSKKSGFTLKLVRPSSSSENTQGQLCYTHKMENLSPKRLTATNGWETGMPSWPVSRPMRSTLPKSRERTWSRNMYPSPLIPSTLWWLKMTWLRIWMTRLTPTTPCQQRNRETMTLPQPKTRPLTHRSLNSKPRKRRMKVRSEIAKYLVLSFLTRPVAVSKKRNPR